LDEGIRLANAVDYGLSASIYSRNVNNAFKFMKGIHSGVCYVNAPTIGAEVHLPFGGVKKTGNGWREAGTEAVKEFTELKAFYVDFSEKLQKAQIDEFKMGNKR
jgi:aldehyde dehydrogenase (NAD+)